MSKHKSVTPTNNAQKMSERNVLVGQNLAAFLGNDFQPHFGGIFGTPASIVEPMFPSMMHNYERVMSFTDV